jgi:hypothetical protein
MFTLRTKVTRFSNIQIFCNVTRCWLVNSCSHFNVRTSTAWNSQWKVELISFYKNNGIKCQDFYQLNENISVRFKQNTRKYEILYFARLHLQSLSFIVLLSIAVVAECLGRCKLSVLCAAAAKEKHLYMTNLAAINLWHQINAVRINYKYKRF